MSTTASLLAERICFSPFPTTSSSSLTLLTLPFSLRRHWPTSRSNLFATLHRGHHYSMTSESLKSSKEDVRQSTDENSSDSSTGKPYATRSGNRQHFQYYNGDNESGLVEEDLSPGGDYIRLLLLPKSFSPEFRENWDNYRTEFWEKENERRSQLRIKLRERENRFAQTEGWLGRLGLGWRASQRRRLVAATPHRPIEPEFKHRLGHGRHQSISKERAPSRRATRSGSHSRTSSRSTTPVDVDDRPPSRSSTSGRPRRGSTASGQELPRRERKGSTLRRGLSPLTQAQIREGVRTPSFSSDDSILPMGISEKDKEESLTSVPQL